MKERAICGEAKNEDTLVIKIGRVTVDEVLKMEEFKGISIKEAEEYVNTLERYCLLMCQYYIGVEEIENVDKKTAA